MNTFIYENGRVTDRQKRDNINNRQIHTSCNQSSGVFKGGGHGSLSPPPRDVGKKCALPVIKCLMDYSTV